MLCVLRRAHRPLLWASDKAAQCIVSPDARAVCVFESSVRTLHTEVSEMTSLYDSSKPAQGDSSPMSREASKQHVQIRRRPREAKVAAIDRVDCSDVLTIAVQHLNGLQWSVDRVDGKWFCDVLHELKSGVYHSPASKSAELRSFLVTLQESVDTHPNAWKTRELSSAAVSIVGFARRGLLPHAQNDFFAEPACKGALTALASAFERRIGDSSAGIVQLTNMLYSLARAGLAEHRVVSKAGAWLSAAEARDDLSDALRASNGAMSDDVPKMKARLLSAIRICKRQLHMTLPAALQASNTAVSRVSPLRSEICEPQHLALLLWSLGRSLPAEGASLVGEHVQKGEKASTDAVGVHAGASAALLRRLLSDVGKGADLSPWHVSALAKALQQLSQLPSGSTMNPSVTAGQSVVDYRAVWQAASAAANAQGAIDRHLSDSGLKPFPSDDATAIAASPNSSLADDGGEQHIRSIFEELADEGSHDDARSGASNSILSSSSLAMNELPGLIRVGWAAVAASAVTLLPLLQAQQLATILEGLSSAACAHPQPAPSSDDWPCPYPRTLVLLLLLQRANGLLKERGKAHSGATKVTFASRFKPTEVAVVLGATARLRRAILAGVVSDSASEGHPLLPWLLEDSVPLSHLGPTPAPTAAPADTALPPPQVPSGGATEGAVPYDGWALASAVAQECSTLLSLAGHTAASHLHENQLRLPTCAALISASVGLAGTLEPSANPASFRSGHLAGLPRGQLTALMTHVSRSVASTSALAAPATHAAQDVGSEARHAYEDIEGEDSDYGSDAGDVSLGVRLDCAWGLVAASGPAAAASATKGGRGTQATAARETTAAMLTQLCVAHAPALGSRQLASLVASCALSSVPPSSAAVLALVTAVRDAATRAPSATNALDDQSSATLAWALPYLLSRAGVLGPSTVGEAGEGLRASSREALVACMRHFGNSSRPLAATAPLATHVAILRLTHAVMVPAGAPQAAAGALSALPRVIPTRLKAVMAAHADWLSTVERASLRAGIQK